MLKNYMTQNFTVVETQTEKKGVNVPVKQTVDDVRAILDGKVDALAPEDLFFIGTLKDLEEKLAAKQKEQAAKLAAVNAPIAPAASPAGATPPTDDKKPDDKKEEKK
jgi:hypothetical protein